MAEQRGGTSMERTAVELVAGGGGLAMAVGNAGFRPILLNEFAKYACDTVEKNGAAALPERQIPPIPAVGENPPLVHSDIQRLSMEAPAPGSREHLRD